MKSLRNFVEDFVMATPLNTVGMGNPSVSPDGIFSEPICAQGKPTRRISKNKRKNNRKQYL